MKSHQLMLSKRVQPVRVPCFITELDFECVFRKHFHHGSYFASGKPKLWYIENQGHSIEKLDARAVGHKRL